MEFDKNKSEYPQWISLAELAPTTPYGPEYLSLLARKKRINAKKIDGVWHTTKEDLSAYIHQQEVRHHVQHASTPTRTSSLESFALSHNGTDKDVIKKLNELQSEFERTTKTVDALSKNISQYQPPAIQAPVSSSVDQGVVADNLIKKFDTYLDVSIESRLGFFYKCARVVKNAFAYVGKNPKLWFVIIFSVGLSVVLPIRSVFGFFDDAISATYNSIKDAQTVLGFRPGTHANDILLINKKGDVSIIGHIETEGQFRSFVQEGIAPIIVESKTKVENLNADYLDGKSTEEFTLAFVTKNGNVTYDDVVLEGNVEVGKTLLVKGATRLLSALRVDGDIGVFGDAILHKTLTVEGPTYLKALLTAGDIIANNIAAATLTTTGSIRGRDLHALNAVTGDSVGARTINASESISAPVITARDLIATSTLDVRGNANVDGQSIFRGFALFNTGLSARIGDFELGLGTGGNFVLGAAKSDGSLTTKKWYVRTNGDSSFKDIIVSSCTGCGSGSGTVNSGAAGSLAFYPSSGTAVDDADALTFDDTNNRLGVGTSSPYAALSVVGEIVGAYFTGTTTATSTFGGPINNIATASSTFASGINLSAGCFAVSGVCVGSGSVNTGILGRLAFYPSNGTTVDDASLLQWDSTNDSFGIGSTTPSSVHRLSVSGNVILDSNKITYASSSATSLVFDFLSKSTSTVPQTINAWSIATGTAASPIISIDGSASRNGSVGFGTARPGVINGIDLAAAGYRILNVTDTEGHGAALSLESSGISGIVLTNQSSAANRKSSGLVNVQGYTFFEVLTDSFAAPYFPISFEHANGNVGINGFTNTYSTLQVYGSSTAPQSFAVVSAASSTILQVLNSGTVGIGTTSPSATLSVHGSTLLGTTTIDGGLTATGSINILGTATSSFARGINISGGCFAIGNTCLSTSGGSSNPNILYSGGYYIASSTGTDNLAWRFNNGFVSNASSTLLNFTFANATGSQATTSSFAITGLTSALHLANSSGSTIPYTGTSCTNQFVRSLDAAGAGACATVANTDLANSTISGVSLGSNLADLTATNGTLTFSGAYNGGTARTVGVNLASANLWTASTTFVGGLGAINATTTNATTTSLAVTNLSQASCDVKALTTGVIYCGTDATSAGAADPFSFTTNYGGIVAATSSSLWFQSPVYASSTLTVQGNTSFGNGTTSTLTVNAGLINHLVSSTSTIPTMINAWSLASSVGATPFFSVNGLSGNIGVGTTNPTEALTVKGSILASKNFWTDKTLESSNIQFMPSPNAIGGRSKGDVWAEAATDALSVAVDSHSSLVYDGKMWVIGGSTGPVRKVYYSTDGITWTEAGTDALPIATYLHASLVYDGKMWVIGGSDGAAVRTVYYSTDGVTWTEAGTNALPVATYYHSSVVYDGKMWVIGGYTGSARIEKVYYSTDGITWTEAGTDALPVAIRTHSSLVYGGKMWVIGGNTGSGNVRTVYYSTDGITWTEAGTNALTTATQLHSSVVYDNKMWVIGGAAPSATKKVYSSTSGSTWIESGTNALPVATFSHSSVVYDGKMWVIGGVAGSAVRKVYYTLPAIKGGLVIQDQSNNELFRVTSSGDIGIGTTSPYSLLTIYKAGSTAANSPQFVLSASSTVSGLRNSLNNWAIGTDSADGGKFKISSSTVIGTNDRLIIDGNGRVGIGTTSPAQLLSVHGNTLISGNISSVASITATGTLTLTGTTNCSGVGTDSTGAVGCYMYATTTQSTFSVNGTSLLDLPELKFPIAANERWQFLVNLNVDTNTTSDLVVAIKNAANAVCGFVASSFDASDSAPNNTDCDASPTGATVSASSAGSAFIVSGYITNTAAGTVQVQVAENGNGTNPSIFKGSTLLAVKMNTTTGADLAEFYLSQDPTAVPGRIVSLDPHLARGVQSARKEVGTHSLLGIISTKPGLVIGSEDIFNATASPVMVALSGRVPVTVSDEGGAIHQGDKIALSSRPGIGKRAAPGEATVGIAMEAFEPIVEIDGVATRKELGSVLVFVNLHHTELPDALDEIQKFYETQNATSSSKTNLTSPESSPSVIMLAQKFGTTVLAFFKSMGIEIAHGFLKVKNLVADTLLVDKATIADLDVGQVNISDGIKVGSAEKPIGITIYDQTSGGPVCIFSSGGALTSHAGECAREANPSDSLGSAMALTLPDSNVSSTTPSISENISQPSEEVTEDTPTTQEGSSAPVADEAATEEKAKEQGSLSLEITPDTQAVDTIESGNQSSEENNSPIETVVEDIPEPMPSPVPATPPTEQAT